MEKEAIFVDGSSFYFGLKRNNFPSRVDYHAKKECLAPISHFANERKF